MNKCTIGSRFNLNTMYLFGVILSLGFSHLSAQGVMRDMSSMAMVREMKLGWNLGNTLDAPDGETTWGNPLTTKPMIDALKTMGFNTVRVTVTWENHMGPSPNYTVTNERMDRVEEVANYVLDNNMYAIINTHHDEWITLYENDKSQNIEKIVKLWTQIANRFKDYGDHLIFETFNEPRLYGTPNEWTGGTPEARSILNEYNEAAVNAIRTTGGNNSDRHIMIPTHAATSIKAAQDDLVIPEPSDRIIVSQHTYWPYSFSLENPGVSSWGSDQDKKECDDELDRIQEKFVAQGIPVIIGEWGSIDKGNTSDRAVHAEYYAEGVRKRGMLPIWWDNGDLKAGGLAILNRSNNSWHFEEIARALVRGAEKGSVQTHAIPQDKRDLKTLRFRSGMVSYSLDEKTPVALDVYTFTGEHLLNLVEAVLPAGTYHQALPINRISGGQYIIRLRTEGGEYTKLIPILR